MDKFSKSINILQGIFSLIHFAEALFQDKPKTGIQKKQLVIDGVQELAKSAEGLTSGGASKTWKKIETVVPDLIDSAANLFYPPNK